MEPRQIQGIQSFKDIEDHIKVLQDMKRIISNAPDHLNIRNTSTYLEQIDNTLSQMEQFRDHYRTFFDRFNSIFADYGWIAYESLNTDVLQSAVEKGESGDLNSAEELLVNYYSPETVKIKLSFLQGLKALRPRMRLLYKALDDYREDRYYACVLVVLSIIDGAVNDTGEDGKGFFAEGADLVAWNSIVGHSSGLSKLAKLLSKKRQKTRIEKDSDDKFIPYRNGILHGMDLWYDNHIVAAKAWATLFAVADWIRLVETDKHVQPVKPSQLYSEQFLSSLNSAGAYIKHTLQEESFVARELSPGKDFPISGDSSEYMPDSPERALVEFLSYWKKKNYGNMQQILDKQTVDRHNKRVVSNIREMYEDYVLKSFKINDIIDIDMATTTITVELEYDYVGSINGQKKFIETILEKNFIMVYESATGDNTYVSRTEPGKWVLTEYYTYEYRIYAMKS